MPTQWKETLEFALENSLPEPYGENCQVYIERASKPLQTAFSEGVPRIADDAGGLIVLAVFYPQAPIVLGWLGFTIVVSFLTWFVFNKTMKVKSFWPYLIFGFVGWWGFMKAGIHPALGLLPMIPTMPHADSDPGIFARGGHHRSPPA